MVTVTGALQAGVTSMTSSYPVETQATLEGVTLGNSEGESCGGTLPEAFAVSCNSVFAPLGVKLGAKRLVAMAKRFGFDETPAIAGAAESTIPPASQIHGDLAVGASALGQDRDVCEPARDGPRRRPTIADGGHRPRPTFAPVGAASGRPLGVPRHEPQDRPEGPSVHGRRRQHRHRHLGRDPRRRSGRARLEPPN